MKNTFYLFLFIVQLAWTQDPLARLESSPRHHEWVTIDKKEQTQGFLVYPEVAEKVPVVLLIHENRGLNDWARSMTDQIAEMGYIALAPDFLSGRAPEGGGTINFKNSDAARTAIYQLESDSIRMVLENSVDFAKKIPAANGKVVVIGFCWGGSQSFRFASQSSEIDAAIVCYGSGPKEAEEYKNVHIPVYGFYGGNDNRVNATLAMSKEAMKQSRQRFEIVIYEGAGHGFFRTGEAEQASQANRNAREAGIERLKTILAGL
ncbi:MAG: dienelactone hydrolase family protein [Flavobacteriaceae bacterium]